MGGIKEFRQLNEVEKDKSVENLLKFIEEHLPYFKDSDSFKNGMKKYSDEDSYSHALCEYFTFKLPIDRKYYFGREKRQVGSSKADISISWNGKIYFIIEAKILPIPNRDKSRNEYEYVFEDGGGIQRFKDGKHGVDNEKQPLLENGMVAYIKQNNFEYWHEKVNTWIDDAQWNQSEKLQKIYFDKIGKLKSTHPRIDNSEVILHHFWVYVNNTSPQ